MTPLSPKDMSPRVRTFAEYATFSFKGLMFRSLNAFLPTVIEAGPKSMQSPVIAFPSLSYCLSLTSPVMDRHAVQEGVKHAKLMTQTNNEARCGTAARLPEPTQLHS